MREQNAATEFGQARQQLEADLTKLKELQRYAMEYQEMVEVQGREGISAQRLLSYHQFVKRLLDAVQEQERQVELSQEALENAEQAWMKQRGAEQNLQDLIGRIAKQEQKEQDRQEQRLQDELAQQRPQVVFGGV